MCTRYEKSDRQHLPMKSFSQHKPYYLIVYWLIFFASIATVYVSIANDTIPRYGFYNSDAISIPTMYKDVVSGYSLAGWLFGPAPSLFPDLPLYFLIRSLSGDVHLAIMLYGVVQITLLVLGFIVLSSLVFEDSERRGIAHAFCLLSASACCVLLATGKSSGLSSHAVKLVSFWCSTAACMVALTRNVYTPLRVSAETVSRMALGWRLVCRLNADGGF